MACTATATEDVSTEIAERLGLRDPLMIRAGFDRPNLSFDIVQFEGKGSKARKLAMLLHGLRDEANRPAIVYCGTRKDTEEVAESLREAGLQRRRLPRGHGPRRARLRPAPLHDRRRRGDRRHQRLRHGRRQGQRALGLALGDPDERRGLLPGGRPRGPRRPPRPSRPARRPLRPRPPGPLHPDARGRARVRLPLRPAPQGRIRPTATSPSTPRASTRTGSSWRSPSEPAPSRWSRPPEAAWSSASTTGSTWPPPEPPARRPRTAPGAPTARSSRSASARAAGGGGCSTTSGTRPRARPRAAAATSAIRSRGCRTPEELEVKAKRRSSKSAPPPSRPLTRGRVAARGAQGLATEGRARQARVHGRQQPDAGVDRRRAPRGPGRTRPDPRGRPGVPGATWERGPQAGRDALEPPPAGRPCTGPT